MPNALGGISRASTTIDDEQENLRRRGARSVIQRRPAAVASVSSAFVRVSATAPGTPAGGAALPCAGPEEVQGGPARCCSEDPVAGVFQHSKRRMFAGVALCGLIALVAAGVNVGAIIAVPAEAEHQQPAGLDRGVARDGRLARDVDRQAQGAAAGHGHARAARRADGPGDDLTARRPTGSRAAPACRRTSSAASDATTAFVPIALTEPGSEQRASEIAWSKRPYRLEVQARPTSPILDVYTQAPYDGARRSGSPTKPRPDCATTCARSRDDQGVPEADLVALRPARQGARRGRERRLRRRDRWPDLHGGLRPLAAVGLVGLVALRRRVRRLRAATRAPHATSPRLHALRERLASHWPESDDDDWPRTTRLLPWMLAVFLAMLWLVPFYSIELNASLPIDMRLDRLLLPFLVGTWLLALAAGRSRRAATQLDVDPRGDRHLPGLRVPQRRARRALPQPHARVRPVAQEAAAPRLLRVAVRDHCQRRAAQRGVRVPDLHAHPRRRARAGHDLGVPVQAEPLLHVVGPAAARRASR